MKPYLWLLGIVPTLLWAQMADDLQVVDGYVRVNLPERSTTAAYMRLENSGDNPLIVTGLHSPDADSVQLHETMEQAHVAHMAPVKTLEIPAHGSQRLSPGGLHMMFMNLENNLEVGHEASVQFSFQDGSKKTIRLPVVPIK